MAKRFNEADVDAVIDRLGMVVTKHRVENERGNTMKWIDATGRIIAIIMQSFTWNKEFRRVHGIIAGDVYREATKRDSL